MSNFIFIFLILYSFSCGFFVGWWFIKRQIHLECSRCKYLKNYKKLDFRKVNFELYSLYRKGRNLKKPKAPAGFIDYFKVRKFIYNLIKNI